MHRVVDYCSDRIWIVVAIVILVLSSYVLLGRALSGSVQNYRADLIEMVELRTGMRAEIGGLSGGWVFFTPTIEINDLDLYVNPGADQAAISAKKIILKVDVLASLLVREPRLVKLSVQGLDLALQRSSDGQYGLLGRGATKSGQQEQGSAGFLTALFHQDNISLQHARITVFLEDGTSLVISDLDAGLRRFAGFYQVAASTEMSGQSLRFVAEINGNPLDWSNSETNFYLRIGTGDILRWIPKSVLEKLTKKSALVINHWHAGTEIWGEWGGGQLRSMRGMLNNDFLDLHYKNAKNPLVFSRLSSQFQLDLDNKNNVQLQLQDFGFTLGSVVWPKGAARINLNPNAKTADVQLERGELSSISALLLHSGILPPSLTDMFETLALSGGFEKTILHVEKESDEAFYLDSKLVDVSCKQWKSIPAVEGLSGGIQVSPRSGLMMIDAEQLSVESPKYFRKKLLIDVLQGPVSWRIDENAVVVDSGEIFVKNSDVTGSTLFSVKAPIAPRRPPKTFDPIKRPQEQGQPDKLSEGEALAEKTSRPDEVDIGAAREGAELYIVARFDDIEGKSLSFYLPPALPEGVLAWLDKGLLEGRLSGRLLYHGSLDWRRKNEQHTLQSDLKFFNATLDYLPNEWPMVTEANGSLFINESDVFFAARNGKVLDSNVEIARGFVGKNAEWPTVHVELHGTYDSPASDALRILNETPLSDVIGGVAETWYGSGRVTGKLSLNVPLEQNNDQMTINVLTRFHNAKLSFPEFNLFFSDLNGQLSYNDKEGLFSDVMTAYFFGQPAEITLPKFELDDGTLFRLELDGSIGLADLYEWSEQPILTFTEGLIHYRAELDVVNPHSITSILRIWSNAEGMQINLPSPFEKAKERRRDTLFQMLSTDDTFHYYLRQNEVFDAYIKMDGDQLASMKVAIAGEGSIPENNEGVSISGKLKSLNWDAWERDLTLLSNRYEELELMRVSELTGPEQETPAFIDQVTGIDLQIEKFDGFGLELNNLSTHAIRNDQSWWINVTCSTLKGVFKVPDDSRPIGFDLDYFFLPEDELDDKSIVATATDPPVAAHVDYPVLEMAPSEFPALMGNIDDLQIDGWKLGKWRFSGAPDGDEYRIDDLEVKLVDQTLKAKTVWRLDGERAVTEFVGVAKGKDVGKLMAVWGEEPSMESKRSTLDFNLTWPYSPLDFSFDKLSGDAELKIKDGRFLDVGAASAIRILGILNFSEVRRRLRLDFGDLVKSGHSFNYIKGPMRFHEGELEFKKLRVKSPSSKMVFNGNLNLLDDTLDMTMDVELEITKNLVAIAALVGGPAAGGGMFIIDRLIGDRLAKVARLKYSVKGTLDEPAMRLR